MMDDDKLWMDMIFENILFPFSSHLIDFQSKKYGETNCKNKKSSNEQTSNYILALKDLLSVFYFWNNFMVSFKLYMTAVSSP